MIGSVLLVALVGLFTYLVYYRIKNNQLYVLAERFEGPPALPLIGNLHLLLGKRSEDMFMLIQQICNEYKTPVRIWVGPMLLLYVTKPADIQRILMSNDCLDKMYIYKLFGWESGVLSTHANVWKNHRKLLNPCFAPSILTSFLHIFRNKSRVLVECLKKKVSSKEEIDIFPFLSACTLDTICATILDFDVDSQNSKQNVKFVEALEELFPIINTRIFSVLLHPFCIYKNTNLYRREKKLREIISQTTDKIIKAKIQSIENERRRKTFARQTTPVVDHLLLHPNVECSGIKCEKNLVDELLKIADDDETETYTDDLIREEIEGIIVVGNETTALTASFVILMLAIHSEVQEVVHAEIDHLWTAPNMTYLEQLNEMRYTEMVIKETLRLYPPGPLIVRKCTENVPLQSGTAPKGANVIINIFGLHHDSYIWGDDVESFNPDRFSPLNIKYRHPYCFIPFSGGKRVCLGYKYAMLSMKSMLFELLRNYRFSTTLTMRDLRPNMNITLKLGNKHMVKIDKRSFSEKSPAL
ncbi:cytochrome P450 4c21-like [Culicoides brevitarsis]|uniref:cytochrome P450 4c21-like n=1 Tax=Culicoides brevitarsis TaxID=469753 RepID=UPI00307B21CD